MGGTFCHYIFMVKHVLPFRLRAAKPRTPEPAKPTLQAE